MTHFLICQRKWQAKKGKNGQRLESGARLKEDQTGASFMVSEKRAAPGTTSSAFVFWTAFIVSQIGPSPLRKDRGRWCLLLKKAVKKQRRMGRQGRAAQKTRQQTSAHTYACTYFLLLFPSWRRKQIQRSQQRIASARPLGCCLFFHSKSHFNFFLVVGDGSCVAVSAGVLVSSPFAVPRRAGTRETSRPPKAAPRRHAVRACQKGTLPTTRATSSDVSIKKEDAPKRGKTGSENRQWGKRPKRARVGRRGISPGGFPFVGAHLAQEARRWHR